MRLLSATLVLLSGVATAADPAVHYLRQAQPVQLMDHQKASKVRFFQSSDQGTTWVLVQETAIVEGQPKPPAFLFKPAVDGSYLVLTRATWRDGRAAEPDPAPGVVLAPDKVLHLVWDTTAPMVTIGKSALLGGDDQRLQVALEWTATDAFLVATPVTIEASTDGQSWTTYVPAGSAVGSATTAIPRTAKGGTVQLRVSARDLAGNVGASAVANLPYAPLTDPAEELAKALTALPDPAKVAPKPVPVAAVAATTGPVAMTPPTTIASPTGAGPDIVEPNPRAADAPPPAITGPVGEAALVDGNDVEAAYFRALATQRGDKEATWRGADWRAEKKAAEQAAIAAAPVGATAPVERAVAPPAEAPFMLGSEAEVTLANARDLARSGDRDGALGLYLLLHRSDQARTSVPEELALLRSMDEHRTIVGIVDNLDPEFISDQARIEQARALLATTQPQRVPAAVARVAKGSPQAREAMLLVGRSLEAQGKPAAATRLYDYLAKGDDAVAREAKAARGK